MFCLQQPLVLALAALSSLVAWSLLDPRRMTRLELDRLLKSPDISNWTAHQIEKRFTGLVRPIRTRSSKKGCRSRTSGWLISALSSVIVGIWVNSSYSQRNFGLLICCIGFTSFGGPNVCVPFRRLPTLDVGSFRNTSSSFRAISQMD